MYGEGGTVAENGKVAAIAKGMATRALLNCTFTAIFGEAATTMLKLAGIAEDAGSFAEAIKSGDPEQIIAESLRLTVSLFTLQCQCFTGDTTVVTAEGDRRIEELEAGDLVLAYDTETGEQNLSKNRICSR